MLKALHVRVRALFCRNVMEAERNEELRFHFEHEVEKHTSAGMSLRRLGGARASSSAAKSR